MERGRGGRGRFFRGRNFYFKNRGRGGRGRGDQTNRKNTTPADNTPGDDNNGSQQRSTQRKASRQPEIFSYTISNCAYPGWRLYHPEEGYVENSNSANKVKSFEQFIKKNSYLFSFSSIEEKYSFTLDIKVLHDDETFMSAWTEFESDLHNHPEHTISCIGLGMHQVVLSNLENEVKKKDDQTEIGPINFPVIRARIINVEPVIQFKSLKSSHYGKLVSVKGTIIRIGNIKLMSNWIAFQCNACSTLQCVRQPDGIYTLPKSCNSDGCKFRQFTPLLSSPFTQTVNWQCIRLQEIVADDDCEGGRVPRTIECELTADLVESCSPGDVVIITGIMKIRNGEEGSKRKSASIFLQYIDVVSVVNNKNQSGGGRTAVEFNMKDYYAIKEIHAQEQLFRLITHSLCPSIFGHEVVKAGLMLCMFGGCQRYSDCRADPHILVVGDPGLGKSKMLQACANVAPRGVYVCGNTSTASGLTLTLNREGGDYALEAGALVLSDQGCCCIDEFDKMTNQHQALLEAMEQQTVSIAKAGVVCSLPARTSILAAANPVGGHYNKAKTVSENLKLGPALLSRFDLVFILLDQPNEHLDILLSDHVMAMHSGLNNTTSALADAFRGSANGGQEEESILNRLKVLSGEELDHIPHVLLRKYIAYAKKYVKPKLSSDAADVLQQFYLELRRLHQQHDCTPVTTRQLESLIRLTEARAKLELREEATAADAKDVIEILKYSMLDTFGDDIGSIDFRRSQHGSGMSSRNQAKKFIGLLQRRAELQSKSMFTVQELKEVAKNGSINVPDFLNFISVLNVQGFLLKKGSQLYQLLTVDY